MRTGTPARGTELRVERVPLSDLTFVNPTVALRRSTKAAIPAPDEPTALQNLAGAYTKLGRDLLIGSNRALGVPLGTYLY